MNNAKLIKILGLVATAVGMGATLLTDWVNEKKMEEKIDECINEKLAALSDEEDEESYTVSACRTDFRLVSSVYSCSCVQ